MKKNKKYLKPLILVFALILLPSIFYILLVTAGNNRYKPLPILGPRTINQADTLYHNIGTFALLNQHNQTFTYPDDIKEKLLVANFFFASCPSICPSMNEQMKKVAEVYEHNDFIRYCSITVDPKRDTYEVLKTYSLDYSTDDKWMFLTGDKKYIYQLAREKFMVNASEGDGGEHDFLHSQFFVLIDTKGRIRGYYDSLNYNEVSKLIDEIKVLITEELREKKRI